MKYKDFDWVGAKGVPLFKRESISGFRTPYMAEESNYDSKLRMIKQMNSTCDSCTMCELGRKEAIKDNTSRDPHVFSNRNPKKFMVIGQNPNWDEICERTPLVGDSGTNFDRELRANKLSRNDFYLTNMIKCYVEDGSELLDKHIIKCSPFLAMEINLINPLLVITLGAAPFKYLCPDNKYSESLKSISRCERFGVKVFAAYHPSSQNLSIGGRMDIFKDQMRVLCGLVKKLKKVSRR
jgi:DNA polymerase